MSGTEIKALVKRYVKPWNTGYLEIFDELWAPDFTFRSLIENIGENLDQLKQNILHARATDPDHKTALEENITDSDSAAYQRTINWTEDGTPKKEINITILHCAMGRWLRLPF